MKSPYLFTSERLGFRGWKTEDLEEFATLNADEEVMKYFPSTLDRQEVSDFIGRLQNHQEKYGYCYFAVEKLADKEFIGFIGLVYQTYKSDFTPATDIGWRLNKSHWGKGFATEGALRCLKLGFEDFKLNKIFSTCPKVNLASEGVMKRIGMVKKGEFKHPRLVNHPYLEDCVYYEITSEQFYRNQSKQIVR